MSAAKPERFYVMQEMDGDECLLFARDTYWEAFDAMRSFRACARDRLSIWSTTRGIVYMPQAVQS